MRRAISVHGIRKTGTGKYVCMNCKEAGPLLYGFRIRVEQNVMRYICRCRGCGRLVTVFVRE